MASPNTLLLQAQIRAETKRQKFIPKDGHVWSPLLRYPKNAKCFCGSGKKFKACHKDNMKMAVLPDEAKQLKAYVDNVIQNNLNR